MKIKRISFLLILFLVFGCIKKNKNKITEILEIAEPRDWVLVIHPEGCKTCLDQLYQELGALEITNGSIVIVAKNTKSMRLNPLFEHSPVPVYLDEEKKLIQEGIVDFQDQILLFSNEGWQEFEILDYKALFSSLAKF